VFGERTNVLDIPEMYEDYERNNLEDEKKHYAVTESNRRVGTATRERFVSRFPRLLAPLPRRAIHALLNESLKGFGVSKLSRFMRWLINGILKLRARVFETRRFRTHWPDTRSTASSAGWGAGAWAPSGTRNTP
jgi:hypothetical protein